MMNKRARGLDQYYTSTALAAKVAAVVRNLAPGIVFEGGTGGGAIYNLLPNPKFGVDVDRDTVNRLQLPGVACESLFDVKADDARFGAVAVQDRVFVSNPPFGLPGVMNAALSVMQYIATERVCGKMVVIVGRTMRKWSNMMRMPREWSITEEHIPDSLALNKFVDQSNGTTKTVKVVVQVWQYQPERLRADPVFVDACADFTVLSLKDHKQANLVVLQFGSIGTVFQKVWSTPDELATVFAWQEKSTSHSGSHFWLRCTDPNAVKARIAARKTEYVTYMTDTLVGNNITPNPRELISIYVHGSVPYTRPWPVRRF